MSRIGEELISLVQTGVGGQRGSRPDASASASAAQATTAVAPAAAAAAAARATRRREAFVNDVAAVENGFIALQSSSSQQRAAAAAAVGGGGGGTAPAPSLLALPTFAPDAEGEILICKVFVGRCKERTPGPAADAADRQPLDEAALAREEEVPLTYVETCEGPSGARSRATSPTASGGAAAAAGTTTGAATRAQRWLVSDMALVLPEYLVQYELVRTESSSSSSSSTTSTVLDGGNGASRLAATSAFERPKVPSAATVSTGGAVGAGGGSGGGGGGGGAVSEPFRRLLRLFLMKCECLHKVLRTEHCLPGERLLDRVADAVPAATATTTAAANDEDLKRPRCVAWRACVCA